MSTDYDCERSTRMARRPPEHGSEPKPLSDTGGLCLLSLDGGGVRGLSTLYILKKLMARLAYERYGDVAKTRPPIKPCEVFDLIGGTSTGGLIAIMLGRLEMTVDECIAAYRELIKDVFEVKNSRLGVGATGSMKAQFSSTTLETAIKRVLMSRNGVSEHDLLDDSKARACRVFVCTTAYETNGISHLRSYSLPGEPTYEASPRIWEAALATCAATRFFDPVQIGARTFVDGALGANNPVVDVEDEAAKIWCPDTAELKSLVKCFISVGTGNPGKAPIEDKVWSFLSKTLVELATQTEKTAGTFAARWKGHLYTNRYFRFNVHQGLQDIGLAEYQKEGAIEAATMEYLDEAEQYFRMRDCAQNLKQRQDGPRMGFTPWMMESRVIENAMTPAGNQSAEQQLQHKPQWLVPFEQNPKFVARETQLDQLDKLLFIQDRCTKVALVGLGGVGKTQIAIELAYRTRAKYPGHSVIWIPATNAGSLEQAYRQIGQQLQVDGVDEKEADIKELVRRRLNQGNSGSWLLIVDNADDVDMWTRKPNDALESRCLKDCLPNSKSCSILFTTRSRKTAFELAGHSLVEVSEMDHQAATRLLQQMLPNRQILNDDPTILQLLEQLTYLPLAITQAAAYMDTNGASFSEYVMLLGEKEEHVVELLSEDFQDEGRYRNDRNPVATTWLVSFEQIRRHDPQAEGVLLFLSCLDSKDIPLSLLPPMGSRKEMIDAIGTLCSYSFVSKRADDVISVHRLVRIATRNWLRMDDRLERCTVLEYVAAGVFVWVLHAFPSNDYKNRSLWRLSLPHAQHLLESKEVPKDDEYRLELMEKVGLCLKSDGRHSEAERIFLQMMGVSKDGKDWHSLMTTLRCMHHLESTYYDQGRQEDADKLWAQSRDIWNKQLQEILASVYDYLGQSKEAEKFEVQRIETGKKEFDKEAKYLTVEDAKRDAKELSIQLSLVAWMQELERGMKLSSMRECSVKMLESGKENDLREHDLSKETIQAEVRKLERVVEIVSKMGFGFGSNERLEEAEQLAIQLLESQKKELGEGHPDTSFEMRVLVATRIAQGRWGEAEQPQTQVVEIQMKELGEQHPRTLSNMETLVQIYIGQGRGKDAERLGLQVLEARKKELGERHPDTLASMEQLASNYKKQEQYQEAESLQVQVSEVKKEDLGERHPDTLSSMSKLAEIYRTQQRCEEAELVEMQVLEARKEELRDGHPDILDSMYALSIIYMDQGRNEEAEQLAAHVLETRKRELGKRHTETLLSMAQLAVIWRCSGRRDDGLQLLIECVKLREEGLVGGEYSATVAFSEMLRQWQTERRPIITTRAINGVWQCFKGISMWIL